MEKINVNLSINELLPEIKFLASSLDDQLYLVRIVDERVKSFETLFPTKKNNEELFFYAVRFNKEMTTQEVRIWFYGKFPGASFANKLQMTLLAKIYPTSTTPFVGLNARYENNHKHYLVIAKGRMHYQDDGIWPSNCLFIFATKEKIEL